MYILLCRAFAVLLVSPEKMLTAALKLSVLLTQVCPALGKFKVMARAVLNLEILRWHSTFCEMKKKPQTLVSKKWQFAFY